MKRWNVGNARRLRDALRDMTKRDQIIRTIRQWWQDPEQAQHRKRGVSAADDAVAILAFAASFDDHRQHVIQQAKISPQSWRGLKQWALEQAQQGRDIPSVVAAVLLGDPPKARRTKGKSPGRPKGNAPGQHTRKEQLAAIVGALRCTPFSALSTTASTDGAFAITAEATLQPFDTVRHAWRAHRGVFGGN